MKKILFVEDDDNKIEEILNYFEAVKNEFAPFIIEVKRSYQSGLNEILDGDFDLILLDMSMHNFEKKLNEPGGEFMQFAGEDILKEMIWNDVLTKTIIVTQYDIIGNRTLKELKEIWQERFGEVYVGTVFYSVNETNWKDELHLFLKQTLL